VQMFTDVTGVAHEERMSSLKAMTSEKVKKNRKHKYARHL